MAARLVRMAVLGGSISLLLALVATIASPKIVFSDWPLLNRIEFRKIADDGFGDPGNTVAWSMAWFQGKVYVGTQRHTQCVSARMSGSNVPPSFPVECPENLFDLDLRAQIWRYTPETGNWEMVFISPVEDFVQPDETVIPNVARDWGYRGMTVFTDKHGVEALYVTTLGPKARILRSVDGSTFEEVPAPQLEFDGLQSFRSLVAFNGKLYTTPAGLLISTPLPPSMRVIYESDDPASGNWQAVNVPGFGDPQNVAIFQIADFNGFLYAGVSNPANGYQVWKTNAQGTAPYTWNKVITNGAYRGPANQGVISMMPFRGRLYVGSGHAPSSDLSLRNPLPEPELIRINPNDTWDLVVGTARFTPVGFKAPISGWGPGFNNPLALHFWRMAVHDGWLYVGTWDMGSFFAAVTGTGPALSAVAGFDIWRSMDGRFWAPVTISGFGNPFSHGARTLLSTPAGLFVGTANFFSDAPSGLAGIEVWVGTPSAAGFPPVSASDLELQSSLPDYVPSTPEAPVTPDQFSLPSLPTLPSLPALPNLPQLPGLPDSLNSLLRR